MKITTVGIDLAKNVIQIHGVDERGKTVLRKPLKRAQVAAFFATLEPCLIGMEACGSAHHWARKLQGFGHAVRLMAPQFVKPYVKTNKNDVADAEAICEAVGRPNMRFVPLKTTEQQSVLALHRARQGFVKSRTAQANAIRGLLGEFGIVMPQGMTSLAKRVPEILEDGEKRLDRIVPTTAAATHGASQGTGRAGGRTGAGNSSLASAERGQLQAGQGSRHWTDHGERAGGLGGRCEELRKRPTDGGLVGVGAPTALERRQTDASGDQQTRRFLSAYAARARREVSGAIRRRQDEPGCRLVAELIEPT